MRNECARNGTVSNGILPNSFKSISSYLKIVSSGASSVASTVRSAASSIVERDNETSNDQVYWAGFDKLELERGITRQVLLLGYSHGFQVWDVEFADNVRNLVSRQDGAVSFMQILPKPIISKQIVDKFSGSHPLLIICADGSFSGGDNDQEGSGIFSNGSAQQTQESSINGSWGPTVIWFYSLGSQSYVHLLRFRSVVHLVRCSPRVVAVLQSAQVHCFNTATLEREYTIVTNPIPTECNGLGNIGFGPLAVGPRWMAYSGSQVAISNSGCVTPEYLNSLPSLSSSNGSNLVAHYAKESSKQIAAGILTLGNIGYKKLSRYYSELSPEENNICQLGDADLKTFGNGYLPHGDDVGMVIVRDIVSKAVIAQFRAHKSPILSLCFDPSGILLVTASVQGHNINVFRIMPGNSNSSSASGPSYVHIYRLQRGITNAVIQDISFSGDSKWIMISSSRGTSHLFAISPSGGAISNRTDASFSTRHAGRAKHARLSNSGLKILTQQSVCASGPAVTLSAVSRIRNGNSWRAGSRSSAIASSFHNCKGVSISGHTDISSKETSYYLLVFSPSGSLIQYGLHISPTFNGMAALSGISTNCESDSDCDSRVVVEALQKWNVCQKQNRFERQHNVDLCVENGHSDSRKVYPEGSTFSDALVTSAARKENVTSEERNHIYISAAELQMHVNPYPLWARSEISFQHMLTGVFNLEDGASEGEIEIEKISVRKLEAKSGELIPVCEYRALKQQEERIPFSSSGSLLDCISSGGVDETWQHDIHLTTETSEGRINTHDSPPLNTQLENVNTRDDSVNENQLRDVHNSDGLEMENQSSEGG